MSKRKISWKNSLLKIAEVFLILIMVATMGNAKPITAEGPLREQTVSKNQYFAVRKTWLNDVVDGRPGSITVNIINKANPSKVVATGELTEANGWRCDFSLPAYSTGTDLIQYAVYEKEDGLDNYIMSNPDTNALDIKNFIIIENNSERQVVTDFVVNNNGFDAVPKGNVLIDTDLDLATVTSMSMDQSIFKYEPNFKIYGDVSTYSNSCQRIIYTGDLAAGTNDLENESIILYWKNKATDVLTGQKYNVRITFSNIEINSKVAIKNSEATAGNEKYVALIAYDNGYLQVNAYFGPTYNAWEKNFPGVKINIKIEVIDDAGDPVDGFTEMYMSDLDQPDYFDMYNADGNNSNWGKYFGVSRNWTESVTMKDGIVSEFYLNSSSDLGYLKNTENGTIKFASKEEPRSNEMYTSVKFLAQTKGTFNYDWIGSNCGTAIVTSSGSAIPSITTFTNIITNTSSFYTVRYFFQKPDGNYDELNPDKVEGPLMIKPSTADLATYVSVAKNAEIDPSKVDSTKKGYVLDTREDKTNVDEEKEVTTSHTETRPQVLNVYFKKAYRVTYHDNVGDEVWNAEEKQNNLGLDYDMNTPVFDGTKSDADADGNPIRPGYRFLGWSKTEDGIIEPVDAKVKGDADYWAHWEALPNEYTVHYFYEVNGVYPSTPDFVLDEPRKDKKTDEIATIIDTDKIPDSTKPNYYLNSAMTAEWSKPVKGDGSTILRVFFKQRKEEIKIPVTGID